MAVAVQFSKKSAFNFGENSGDRQLLVIFLLKILNYCEKMREFDIYGITIEVCHRSLIFNFNFIWRSTEAVEASHTLHLDSRQLKLSGKLC